MGTLASFNYEKSFYFVCVRVCVHAILFVILSIMRTVSSSACLCACMHAVFSIILAWEGSVEAGTIEQAMSKVRLAPL